MKKQFFCFLLASSTLFLGFSQNKKNAVAVSLGSSGIGVEYARKVANKLNVRISYHTLEINDQEVDVSSFIDSEDVNFLGSVRSTILYLGAEYVPFSNSSFKLTFGVGFLNDVGVNGLITYKEDVTYGDVTIQAKDVGKVDLQSTWSGTAPFLGIGFGRAIPKNRIGVSFEFGTYFASSPTVNLQADRLLSPTQDQEANLQDAFESLKFIPRAQLKIAIKL